jgi:putative tryptophan/tyrosine transport system substrate-binding protein
MGFRCAPTADIGDPAAEFDPFQTSPIIEKTSTCPPSSGWVASLRSGDLSKDTEMRRREFVGTLGSAAIALPLAARAQQRPVPVIGFLGVASPGPSAQYVAAFHQGLSETGYVEGQNVTTEYRWAEDSYDRLPRLAADLVDHKVDVILATGGTAGAMAAKSATSTIPIVFTSGDAIADRLVDNLTGVSILAVELIPKRVELMSELAPGTRVIALVVNPNNPNAERVMRDAHEAARAKGMQLHVLKAGSEPDFEPALASVTQLQAARCSSSPIRSSRSAASSLSRSRRAIPFPRFIRGASSWSPAGSSAMDRA